VGAFVGEYALAARSVNSAAPIYAFEPNPMTVPTLRQNCEGKGIHVLQLAVAELDGSVQFHCAGAQSGVLKVNAPEHAAHDVVSVQAVTLDEWANKNQVCPSLIKIDVEGAEAKILRSAQKVLIECSPAILCEVLTDEAGQGVMEVLPANYLYYYIEENGGYEVRPIITRHKWRNHNWLLVPRKRQNEWCP
jgi:FkbM family methyltransferase